MRRDGLFHFCILLCSFAFCFLIFDLMSVWTRAAAGACVAIPSRRFLHPPDKRRELLLQLGTAAMQTGLLFFAARALKEFAYLPAVAALILKYRHYITPDSKFA
jgi:hypothetical protein